MNGVLSMIADGDLDTSKGRLNNAGWYSVDAVLDIKTAIVNDTCSSFLINVDKLRINGKEYLFPKNSNNQFGVHFGIYPTNPGQNILFPYIDNFSGITTDHSVKSIKTILTVEPEIIGAPGTTITVKGTTYTYDSQGLAEDPYVFIKVEGIVE